MFSFFKREKKPAAQSSIGQLLAPEMLSDRSLVDVILGTFKNHPPVVAALFLVAYENLSVFYSVFATTMQPATMEGFAKFAADAHANYTSNSTEDEINRRRLFYLYLASLLKVAHIRARLHPELWDSIAEIWVAVLPGARALRKTLNKTALWSSDEIEFFASVKSEQDGETYCLSMLAPQEVRYHPKVIEWQESAANNSFKPNPLRGSA